MTEADAAQRSTRGVKKPVSEPAHEAFDAEPTRELAEGEAKSPAWLPAVGALLFVVLGLYWALGGDAAPAGAGAAVSTAASATAAAAVEPPAALPAPLGGGSVERPVSPADIDRMRERMRKMREQKQAEAGGQREPAPPPASPARPSSAPRVPPPR